MKADITPFRGPNFAAYKPGDLDKRTVHYTPLGEDEPVAVDIQPMSGLAITYWPGEIVRLVMGNIELSMTVAEWEALKPKVDKVIVAGRINAEAAMIDNTPTPAFEL